MDPTSIRDLAGNPAIAALLKDLSHVGELVRQSIQIPQSTRVVDVIRPATIETLLDQSVDDPEQNLPYWAEIWPSGIVLAAEILKDPARVTDLPVLELGSGVGITAAIALEAGAHLTATDYAPESLAITRLTCRLLTGREPRVRQVNWRAPDANLLQDDGSRWPVVLAADVLYEERDIEPVLDVFERILAPGGFIWLTEPGRRPSQLAVHQAARRGWTITTTTMAAEWPDPKDEGVVVRIHTMQRP
jgi:predicted nicotinamide N-methyase